MWAIIQKKRAPRGFYTGFDRGFNLLFCGYCTSIFVSTFVEGQPFLTSCMVMIPHLTYFLFYLFKKYGLTKELMERIVITISILYAMVIVLNFITYPFVIFGKAELDLSRGGIRNRVPGVDYAVFVMLYFINRFLSTNGRRYIVYSGAYFILICLSLTRQTIAISALLGMLFFFNKISIGRKLFLGIVAFLMFQYVVPQIPLVQNMMNLTEEQSERNAARDEDDIRIQGYKYFLIEGQQDIPRFFMGHGKASFGNSAFGDRREKFEEETRIFAADVCFSGFLYIFGFIAWLGLMFIMIKGILVRKSPNLQYITYFLLYILLTSLASGPFVYGSTIILIVGALYIAAYDKQRIIHAK